MSRTQTDPPASGLRPSGWQLLRPRWIALLLLVVAADIAMVRLGQWQWHSARHTGNITNYSYAIQWWAFTVFAVLMYGKIARDFLRSDAQVEAAQPTPVPAPSYLAYSAPSSVRADDTDPERARFNDYLSSLYAADSDATRNTVTDRSAPA